MKDIGEKYKNTLRRMLAFDEDDVSTGHVSLNKENDIEELMWEVFSNEKDYTGSYPVENMLNFNPANRCIEYDPKCPRYDLPALVVDCDKFVRLLANKNVSFYAERIILTGNVTENISKTTRHIYDSHLTVLVMEITEENTFPEWRNTRDVSMDVLNVEGIHLTDDYDYSKPIVIGGRAETLPMTVLYDLMYSIETNAYYDDRQRKLEIVVHNVDNSKGFSDKNGCTLSLYINNERANTLWPPIPYGLTLRNIEVPFYELLNVSKTEDSFGKLGPYLYKLDGYSKIGYLGTEHKYGRMYDSNDNGVSQMLKVVYTQWEEIPPGMNESPITKK